MLRTFLYDFYHKVILNMFDKIQKLFFPDTTRFREEFYAASDKIFTDVAARFSRGNVAMQMGHILTREQLNKELDLLEEKITVRNK
jgi:hypothetical protein